MPRLRHQGLLISIVLFVAFVTVGLRMWPVSVSELTVMRLSPSQPQIDREVTLTQPEIRDQLTQVGQQTLSQSQTPAQAIQNAWRLARDSGHYQFRTDIEQITYPAPSLENVGRSNEIDTLYMEGQTDIPAERMHLTLWDGSGSILAPETGLDIRIEDNQAFGRYNGSSWEELDSFVDTFAPSNDHLSWLLGLWRPRIFVC
ncbi:MAG: hypothetical protein AAF629_00560 [Chloroflexota bacterium]